MDNDPQTAQPRNNRRNRPLFVGFLIGFLAIVAAVAIVKYIMPPRELPDRTIRIGYSPYALNLPIFVAKERNLFGDRPVEMIRFQSTDSMATALIRGDIDIASAIGTERLILMNENEHDVVVAQALLFNAFRTTPWTEAILVSATRDDIKSIKDLNGKSIGTLPAATAVAYCRLIAEAHGIKFSSIQQVNPTEALGSLAAGRIDALLAVEPQIAFGRHTGTARILAEAPVATSLRDPMLVGAHCIQQKRLDSDPDLGPLCYRALSEAAAYTNEHRLEALALAAKYINMPEDVLRNTQLPDWIPAGDVDKNDLAYLVQLFAAEGILTHSGLPHDILYMPNN